MNLEEALYKYFGYTSFRPGQREIIESVLKGSHTLGMLPTGTGKSLCYQLPSYLMSKPALIVSPLLSLMQDQAEHLKVMGEKSVLALNSFLSIAERRRGLEELHKYRFIFVSPEMLSIDHVLAAIQRLDIGLFVIDEAHCISQWGYDFRPDYLRLGEVRKKLNCPLTLALTATASEEVRLDIISKLGLEHVEQVISSVDRANIALSIEICQSHQEKQDRLLEMARELDGSGIIYFSSKKAAESAAAFLQESGIPNVEFYHGGMESEQRMLIQQQFIIGQVRIICATSAFGMGINKQDVRFVIHFHLPSSMESYLQEIGRAGRDGKQSIAVLLYCAGDEGLPALLMEQELPTDVQIESVLAYLALNKVDLDRIPKNVHEIIYGQYSLSETQWRFMNFFISSNRTNLSMAEIIEAMKHYVKERIAYKNKQLQGFLKWLTANSCRREGVLLHFGEKEAITRPKFCCDRCGLGEGLFSSISELADRTPIKLTYEGWRQDLENILVKKREQKHEE
ncbi:RecQ family ATP-dependent DNA helicase [Peribacillus sp. SCS-155]|uniref:RecQ family ATP-dependent DNA helicase n=1 Tax=Peribacillus sedimenti TaxID=3115297 RepID=UPI0039058013